MRMQSVGKQQQEGSCTINKTHLFWDELWNIWQKNNNKNPWMNWLKCESVNCSSTEWWRNKTSGQQLYLFIFFCWKEGWQGQWAWTRKCCVTENTKWWAGRGSAVGAGAIVYCAKHVNVLFIIKCHFIMHFLRQMRALIMCDVLYK